jgi:general secretion pathway protein G
MCIDPDAHMDVPTTSAPSGRRMRRSAGFTLLEIMFACAVGALLLAIAVPAYRGTVERQKIRVAVNDLLRISMAVERYRTTNGMRPPDSLDDLTNIARQDPWGFQYQYLSFYSDEPGLKSKIRKDHNLHPLNSEYDLYSMGPDGESVPPLTGAPSQDDIVFARDGGFIGPAKDF